MKVSRSVPFVVVPLSGHRRERDPNIHGIQVDSTEVRHRYADDGVALPPDGELLAKNGRVRAKPAFPERIAQNRNRGTVSHPVFIRDKEPTSGQPRAKDRQKICRRIANRGARKLVTRAEPCIFIRRVGGDADHSLHGLRDRQIIGVAEGGGGERHVIEGAEMVRPDAS